MSYKVYKRTCTITGKSYIGITSKTLEERSGEHGEMYLRKQENGAYKHPKLANAINKYGWESFTSEILEDGLTLNEAEMKEQEYVKKYDSEKNGYNCTSGGEKTKAFSEETRKRMSEARKRYFAENPDARYTTTRCLMTKESRAKARANSDYEYLRHIKRKKGIAPPNKGLGYEIAKLDPDTLEVIAVYPNAAVAAHANGLKTGSPILKCCHDLRATAGKFKWRFTGNDTRPYNKDKKR